MNKFPIYPKYEPGDYCGYEFDPQTHFTDVSQLLFTFLSFNSNIKFLYFIQQWRRRFQ